MNDTAGMPARLGSRTARVLRAAVPLGVSVLMIGAALGSAGTAAAQGEDPAHALTLEELSVAGDRGESVAPPGAPPPPYPGGQVARGGRFGLLGDRAAMDTPFSATSYTAKHIEDQQARTLSEVLASDPSVGVTTPRFGFSDQISVRGFTLNEADASLNGIGGILPPRRLPFDSIERVELIRGPVQMLTGAPPGVNIGGSLNYVTKRAPDVPVTRVTTGFISDGNVGTAVDVGRRFGVDGAWGLRINGSFRDGALPPVGETERLGNVAVALDYRGESVRFSLDGGAFAFRQQQYSQVILSLAPGALMPRPPRPDSTLSPPWQRVPIEGVYGLGRIEFDLGADTVLDLGYGRSYTTERSVQTFLTNLRANGDVTAVPAAFPFWSRNDGAEASLRTRFETGPLRHEAALAGNIVSQQQSLTNVYPLGSVTTQNIYRPFVVPEPGVAGIDFYPPKNAGILLTSAAVADTISALDGRVQFTLGGRQQRIAADSFSTDTRAKTAGTVGEAFTPAYGLLLRPVDPVSVYANLVDGLVRGPTAPAGSVNVGEILAPTRARQAELGAKIDFGGFGLQAALFRIEQQSAVTDPVSNRYGYIGLQRNQGADIQVFGEAAAGLRLLGGVEFIEGRLTATAGGRNDGRRPPGIPSTHVSLQAEYDLSALAGLTFFGRIVRTGRVFFDAANTQVLPGWTRLDLGLSYTTRLGGRPVTLRALIENVFDVSYWQAAARPLLSLGAPRTFLLSASVEL